MDSNKAPGWFALVFCLIASLGAWFNLRADRVDAEIDGRFELRWFRLGIETSRGKHDACDDERSGGSTHGP